MQLLHAHQVGRSAGAQAHLLQVQHGQVGERVRHLRMLRPQHRLVHRQRALVKRLRQVGLAALRAQPQLNSCQASQMLLVKLLQGLLARLTNSMSHVAMAAYFTNNCLPSTHTGLARAHPADKVQAESGAASFFTSGGHISYFRHAQSALRLTAGRLEQKVVHSKASQTPGW